MDADGVAEFAQASAESRHAVFGPLSAPRGIRIQGRTLAQVTVSTVSTERELERGGWLATTTAIVRVLRVPGFLPRDGDSLLVVHSGLRLRVTQIKDNVPGEWVLGCSDPED